MFIRKPTLKEWKIFYVIEEVALKNDAFINVLGNQEKRIGTIFKNLVYSNSMSKEMRQFVKPVGTRPGIMYGNCQVHQQQVDDCPHFVQLYQLYGLLPITLLSFWFPEICEQDPTLPMGMYIEPDYVNDSLVAIRNKLTELEDRSRRNNIQIDRIAEEPGETWEKSFTYIFSNIKYIFKNMADNTDMLRDEERITKLIKKIFEDEFKKQEQNFAKIISGNLEIRLCER